MHWYAAKMSLCVYNVIGAYGGKEGIETNYLSLKTITEGIVNKIISQQRCASCGLTERIQPTPSLTVLIPGVEALE